MRLTDSVHHTVQLGGDVGAHAAKPLLVDDVEGEAKGREADRELLAKVSLHARWLARASRTAVRRLEFGLELSADILAPAAGGQRHWNQSVETQPPCIVYELRLGLCIDSPAERWHTRINARGFLARSR